MKSVLSMPNIMAVYEALRETGVKVNHYSEVSALISDIYNAESEESLRLYGWLYRTFEHSGIYFSDEALAVVDKSFKRNNKRRVKNGQVEVEARYIEIINTIEKHFKKA